MALLTPPPAAPQRGDRTTFAGRVDAFITWLINFVTELVSLVANLNSIAAGGAYAIPYAQGAVGSASGGKAAPFGGSSQATATQLHLDYKDSSGKTVSAWLDSVVAGATSGIKATIRIVAAGDQSKYVVYSVSGYSDIGTNKVFNVSAIASSAADPFAAGDPLLLFFQRTGDKGDTGAAASLKTAKFSDRKSSGTSGGVSTGNSNSQVRGLNTADHNNITGFALASNIVTASAGSYFVEGRAPAYGVGAHKAMLCDADSGAVILIGSSAYSGGAGNGQTDSVFSGLIQPSSTTRYVVRHYTATSGDSSALGVAAGNGQSEVYTEVTFTKIA